MAAPLRSLMDCGTKLWLDSIDPELVRENRAWGATGATSNPLIVADLIQTGRFDAEIEKLLGQNLADDDIAWEITDQLVRQAQQVFLPVWRASGGDDGYVSFELDPLLEDPELGLPLEERVARYVALGKKWSDGHENRLIKVPATEAGLAALEELAALGVPLNVTLIFTTAQYRAARAAVWRGARKLRSLERFKSVYSIFVSRVDVYAEKHVPELSAEAVGQVGIVNAKRIWAENQEFWRDKHAPLAQEIVFASTGVKKPSDPAWKYVEAFAGSDIQTNPPATNQAVHESGLSFSRQVDQLPSEEIVAQIDQLVDFERMEQVLMEEGIEKFAAPQRTLLSLIATKRSVLSGA